MHALLPLVSCVYCAVFVFTLSFRLSRLRSTEKNQLPLCLRFCNIDLVILKSNYGSWKTNPKGLAFRRGQDCACCQKGWILKGLNTPALHMYIRVLMCPFPFPSWLNTHKIDRFLGPSQRIKGSLSIERYLFDAVVECVLLPDRCVVVSAYCNTRPLLLLWSLPFPGIERLVAERGESSWSLELAWCWF